MKPETFEREVIFHMDQGRTREEAEQLVRDGLFVPARQTFKRDEFKGLFDALLSKGE